MDHNAEAQAALAAWDDQTIDITDDDGDIIRGTVARAEWVIKRLRAAIETPATTEAPEQIARHHLDATLGNAPSESMNDLTADDYEQLLSGFIGAVRAAIAFGRTMPETPEQIAERVLPDDGNSSLWPDGAEHWEPGAVRALILEAARAGIQAGQAS